MANTSLSTGQSVTLPATGAASLSPSINIANLSPNGPNPQTLLDGPNVSQTQTIMRFPGDTPPYYMCLVINKYSRANWLSVGQLNETARIILPLPREMVDNHNIRYAVEDLGFSGAVGFDAASLDAGAVAATTAAGGSIAAGRAALGQFGTAGQVISGAVKGALAASGLAVNDFMTVMLKGPDYKRRDFIWRFAPKTAAETQSLRQIIQLINNSMAPSITSTSLGSAFFTWPSIWLPSFVWNGVNDFLALNTFRMKPSVITDFSVNYTPNGSFAPFATTKAPSSVDIRMSFLELEYWLQGNFSDDPTTSASNLTLSDILGKIKNVIGNVDISTIGTAP